MVATEDGAGSSTGNTPEGPKAVRWAAPEMITVNGKPFRVMAGPNGSIQGPAERKWGYTVQTVSDLDGDGKLDIIFNSIFCIKNL